MKKKTLFCAIFLVFSMLLQAQQDPQYSQTMFTKLVTNPGYAGSEGEICAYALERLQWTGFGDGAPTVTVFNVDAPIKRFGLGLSLENDELGFDKNFKINLSIAYKFPISNGNLGVGVKWGVANSAIDLGGAQWVTPGVPVENDIAIPEDGSEAMTYLDFGFGLYYKTQDLYLGISSTHLNEPKIEYDKGSPSLKRHYYITAGYNLPFSNPLLVFKPNIFVQSDGKNSQLAIIALIEYNKSIWGGVSLRTDNAITGIFGVKLFNWVKVSYSYDYVVSDLMGNNNGTHEIMMGFCLDVKKDKTPERYKSIRFL